MWEAPQRETRVARRCDCARSNARHRLVLTFRSSDTVKSTRSVEPFAILAVAPKPLDGVARARRRVSERILSARLARRIGRPQPINGLELQNLASTQRALLTRFDLSYLTLLGSARLTCLPPNRQY
jgi:hypothetical protein